MVSVRPQEQRELPPTQRKRKKTTDRKNLEICEERCVWNAIKIDTSSSKRGQQEKYLGLIGGLISANCVLWKWRGD
jgi:hypothetical protein